jgi:histidine phosphotransfer protein HptB
MTARACVERHEAPTDVLEYVVQLRPLFDATLALLEREASPPMQRRAPATFGRRSVA